MTDGVSTTTRNPEAERLRRLIRGGHPIYEGDLDSALAVERRNVMARAKERLFSEVGRHSPWKEFEAVLDELGEQRP